MPDITMLDTTDPSSMDGLTPEAVAGYGSGIWPTYEPLCAKFPNAHHRKYAIAADQDGDILDIENGDASPSDAPGWVKRQWARGLARPGLYANFFTMFDVVAALNAAGIPLSRVFTHQAHYTYQAHRCTPQLCVISGRPSAVTADMTQYDDHYLGRNIDASLCADYVFATTAPAPTAAPTQEGNMICSNPNGGIVVARPDGSVFAFDGAAFCGGLHGTPLNKPIVGIAVTPSGNGYWMIGSDGGVFAFGDAKFLGSLPGHPDWHAGGNDDPCIGIAAEPASSPNGYVIVCDRPQGTEPDLYRFPRDGSLVK